MAPTNTYKYKSDVLMTRYAWDYFWSAVHAVPGEIGLWGYVTPDPSSGLFVVDDVFIVPQEADASQVDFIEDGLPYALERAVREDRVDDLRVCLHSHGTHGVFWSGTDDDMIENKMRSTGVPWFVSIVGNRADQVRCRLDVFDVGPFHEHAKYDEMNVYCEVDAEMAAIVDAAVVEHVRKPSPVVRKGTGTTYSSSNPPHIMGVPQQQAWGDAATIAAATVTAEQTATAEVLGLSAADIQEWMYGLDTSEEVCQFAVIDMGWSFLDVGNTRIFIDDDECVRLEVYLDSDDIWLTWTPEENRTLENAIERACIDAAYGEVDGTDDDTTQVGQRMLAETAAF